jgi:hypothetical protein
LVTLNLSQKDQEIRLLNYFDISILLAFTIYLIQYNYYDVRFGFLNFNVFILLLLPAYLYRFFIFREQLESLRSKVFYYLKFILFFSFSIVALQSEVTKLYSFLSNTIFIQNFKPEIVFIIILLNIFLLAYIVKFLFSIDFNLVKNFNAVNQKATNNLTGNLRADFIMMLDEFKDYIKSAFALLFSLSTIIWLFYTDFLWGFLIRIDDLARFINFENFKEWMFGLGSDQFLDNADPSLGQDFFFEPFLMQILEAYGLIFFIPFLLIIFFFLYLQLKSFLKMKEGNKRALKIFYLIGFSSILGYMALFNVSILEFLGFWILFAFMILSDNKFEYDLKLQGILNSEILDKYKGLRTTLRILQIIFIIVVIILIIGALGDLIELFSEGLFDL